MSTYPKIADNEMNYFQFKARQMLLLKKEDQEWQNFCHQIAPECAACLSEKTDAKELKNIGIQTNPKTLFKKLEKKPSLPTTLQNKELPEALNNIKIRLENIDLALSTIYDFPDKEIKQEVVPISKSAPILKLSEEKRRQLIHKSLKTSLENPPPKVAKPTTLKLKNSSYFLPHDLQVKRAAARKAYLASLQTKPKVTFQNERYFSKKKTQIDVKHKKLTFNQVPKSKKKAVGKKINKLSTPNEEDTLVSSVESDEIQDENIENIVDAIIDDLFGEAALDLNKIKQKRREKEFYALKRAIPKELEKNALLESTLAPFENTIPKSIMDDESSREKLKLLFSWSKKGSQSKTVENYAVTKLKSLLDTSKELHQAEPARKEHVTANTASENLHTNKLEHILEGINESDPFESRKIFRVEDTPKFVCDVTRTIKIDPETAKNISEHKEKYWKYLKNISRTVKGNFNPWVLNNMLAESILDDCIKDIAEELSAMPSIFVQDLYNQEFLQQVEE